MIETTDSAPVNEKLLKDHKKVGWYDRFRIKAKQFQMTDNYINHNKPSVT